MWWSGHGFTEDLFFLCDINKSLLGTNWWIILLSQWLPAPQTSRQDGLCPSFNPLKRRKRKDRPEFPFSTLPFHTSSSFPVSHRIKRKGFSYPEKKKKRVSKTVWESVSSKRPSTRVLRLTPWVLPACLFLLFGYFPHNNWIIDTTH